MEGGKKISVFRLQRICLRDQGGNGKQGFQMKNSVFANHRVRVLLNPGNKYFKPRRDEERKPSLACNFS